MTNKVLKPNKGGGIGGGRRGEGGQDPPIGSIKAVTEEVRFLDTFISIKHPI